MTIVKFLNILNNNQKAIILADIENIMNKCEEIACVEYNDQKNAKTSHDTNCPSCHAKKDQIVDKIALVQGKGNVSSSFNFNLKFITGNMEIDTHAINHCNKCGNEWKKFKTKYISKTNIVRVILNYLAQVNINSNEKKQKSKLEAIKIFDNCYAESIYRLCKQNSDYLNDETIKKLKLKCLRKHYKSVFDK